MGPEILAFEAAWKKRSGVAFLARGTMEAPFECVKGYADGVGEPIASVTDRLLDAYERIFSQWDGKRHAWTAHLFCKHFDAIQAEASKPKKKPSVFAVLEKLDR